jgi:hypothetical protein
MTIDNLPRVGWVEKLGNHRSRAGNVRRLMNDIGWTVTELKLLGRSSFDKS